MEKHVLTDEEFKLLKKRDRNIFEKVYNANKNIIFTFLLAKSMGNTEVTEEIFAETALAVYEALPNIKSKDKITSWWYSIASNKFNDYLRKHFKKKSLFTVFENSTVNGISDKGFKPDEETLHNEKVRYIISAMESIKPKYKKILELKYYEEKSQKEISNFLKCHEKALEGLLFRARKALKKEIERLYQL